MVRPSEMIMLGDSKPDGSYDGSIDPVSVGDNANGEQWPSNRHNKRTYLMFADGHSERPLRNDVIDPNKDEWRRLWNKNNQPAGDNWTVNAVQAAKIDP